MKLKTLIFSLFLVGISSCQKKDSNPTEPSNYKKLIIGTKSIIILCFFITIYSCKKNENSMVKNNSSKEKYKDSLLLLRDTVLLKESSEGQEIKLLLDYHTRDSVIISEIYGETGKEFSKFLFNTNLIYAENRITTYKEPISINSNPVVKQERIKTLRSSGVVKKELTAEFKNYRNLFILKKIANKISLNEKWIGNYSFLINENSEDWRDENEIELKISEKEIIYTETGYQLYNKYQLDFFEKEGMLFLKYKSTLEGGSAILEQEKNFGTLQKKGSRYSFKCPYLNLKKNEPGFERVMNKK